MFAHIVATPWGEPLPRVPPAVPRPHYYRCNGLDGWRHPNGPVCDNPPVRAEDLDEAVWNEVLALLETPELIQSEIRRRPAAANDTDSTVRRLADLQSELARCQAQSRRLVDAYQESVVTLDELRDRNLPLRTRQRTIESEIKAIQAAELDRSSRLTLALSVDKFVQRMREGERTMPYDERQELIRLLVREVQVGKEGVTICHSIPLSEGPDGTPDSSSGKPPQTKSNGTELLSPRSRNGIYLRFRAYRAAGAWYHRDMQGPVVTEPPRSSRGHACDHALFARG